MGWSDRAFWTSPPGVAVGLVALVVVSIATWLAARAAAWAIWEVIA